MELSIGNLGARPLTEVNGTSTVTKTTAAETRGAGRPDVVFTSRAAGPDEITAVPDSALDRNDPLGGLLKKAWDLPPPAMPAFT